MNQFSVIDESFDISLASSYYISIRVSPDGFSFCVLDPIYNRFIQFKECYFPKKDSHWHLTIEKLALEELLKNSFKRKILTIEDDPFALVPTALYRADKALDLINGTFQTEMSGMDVLENQIKMVDAVNVFGVSTELLNVIKISIPDIKILHHVTSLVESTMLDDFRTPDQVYVHVYFRKSVFDVVVMGHRELKLANRFAFVDDNEVIYFLLFIYEQLKLQTAKTELIVSGDIEPLSSRFLLLKSYLKTVKLAEMPSHFQLSEALMPVSIHRNMMLFNSFLCV